MITQSTVPNNRNTEICMFSDFLKRNNVKHPRTLSMSPDWDTAAELEQEAIETTDRAVWDSCLRNLFVEDVCSAYKSIDRYPFNDKELVETGLHVFRRVFSQYAHSKRAVNGSEKYDKEGLVIYENFLDEEMLDGVRKEFDQFQIGVVNKQPHNIIAANVEKAPNMFDALAKMRPLVFDCIGVDNNELCWKFISNTFAQRVDNSPDDNDNQKNCHVDTFFPAIKWWYFPDEVKVEQGPFWYAMNSCYPTDEYLDWLYQESIKCIDGTYDAWKLKDHQEGSFRASDGELEVMGFDVKPVPVKANTLVIGNVGGFHRRGDTVERHVRNAIHGSIRIDNPFVW